MPDARHLSALGAHQLDVAGVQRALTLDDPALDVLLRVGPGVALDHVQPLDDDAVLRRQDLEDAALLAAVLTGGDHDLIIPANGCLQFRHASFLTGRLARPVLQDLRSERDDLHEPPLAELARHRPEDTGPDRLVVVVHQHGGVAVEADVAAVAAALLLGRPHDHGLDDLPLLHRAVRRRFLHRRLDDAAEPGVGAARPANRVDYRDLARAGVVGDVQDGTHLNHVLSPRTARTVRTTRTARPIRTSLNLLRLLDHARHDPALAGAERTRFSDGDDVAGLRLVVLVVGDELRRLLLALAVDAVPHLALDSDDHRLVHLVADDRTGQLCLDAHISRPIGPLRAASRDGPAARGPSYFGPAARGLSYFAFSRRIVLMRARSLRTPRTLAGASSWPIDF